MFDWLKNIGGSIMNMFKGGGGNASNFSTAKNPLSTAQWGQPTSNFMAMNPASFTSSTAGMQNPISSGGNWLTDMFKNPKVLSGLGMMGVSKLMPTPKAPALPSSTDVFRQFAQTGNPNSQAANQRLQGLLAQPIDKLTPEEETSILDPIRRAKQDKLKYIQDVYRNLRPGSDPTTDSTFAKDLQDLEQEFAGYESDAVTKALMGKRNQLSGDITQAQQINMNDASQLAAIAQMDIDQIQRQFNVDWETAWYYKNMVGQLGQNTLYGGISGNPYGGLLNKIFGGQ